MTQVKPTMHIQTHSISRWKHYFSRTRFHSGPNSLNLENLDIFHKTASLLLCQCGSSLECFLGQKEPPWPCLFLPALLSTSDCCSEAEQPTGHAKRAFCNQLLSIREVWAELMSLTGMNCLFPCSNSPACKLHFSWLCLFLAVPFLCSGCRDGVARTRSM